VQIEHSYINNFIGQDVEGREVVRILEQLGFGVRIFESSFIVTIPPFRHDVNHSQDIIEELVRIIGIDNISSKALNFSEIRVINSFYEKYKKRTHFRQKAASIGFFETIHYFFDNKSLMQKYGIDTVKNELDVTNPITNELNTLRTTLVLNLINSASRNIKFGKKGVKLFEVGKVVLQDAKQIEKIAFIFSGEVEAPAVSNHGKPKTVDFFEFAKQISMAVGEIELQKSEEKSKILSPYESSRVFIDGCDVGFMARVHLELEKEFDLPKTYICELSFDELRYEKIIASPYSKFPSLSRDLSLIIPKELSFSTIREHLDTVLPKEVIGFAPIDIYESQQLGDDRSVTVKFHLQSPLKTLQEEQILTIMDMILVSLKDKFGIGMR
jgi:phenylalanyl-tRNA synthetase beta chain